MFLYVFIIFIVLRVCLGLFDILGVIVHFPTMFVYLPLGEGGGVLLRDKSLLVWEHSLATIDNSQLKQFC